MSDKWGGLTMGQVMAIHDRHGRIRCPVCGAFATLAELTGQPAHVQCGEVRLACVPICRRCRAKENDDA